ncbi:UNVERIFIED_CONTAM: hypothetical protein FKN15_006632 [Acipenser sinensis]
MKNLCIGFLGRFYQTSKAKPAAFTPVIVEKELILACRDAKGKENRLCYYLGATSDAATKMTSEVTRPMSSHVPVQKICEKLQKKDSQICELRYEKQPLDFSSAGLPKLKHCFGSAGDTAPDTTSSESSEVSKPDANSPGTWAVTVQPESKEEGTENYSTQQARIPNGSKSVSNGNVITKHSNGDHVSKAASSRHSSSKYSNHDFQHESSERAKSCTYIPRPSIIKGSEESPKEDELSGESDLPEKEDGTLSDNGIETAELTEGLTPAVRRIMADPDYDDDSDELVKPKKLINPVKTSRNHQDLHRELLMNQKR